jgi:hypothetical protein
MTLKTSPILYKATYALKVCHRRDNVNQRMRYTLSYALLGLLIFTLSASISLAGPWLIKKGSLEVGVGTYFGYSNHEFLNDEPRTYQRFPLGGELWISGLKLDTRYGLKEDLELTVSTYFQSIIYASESAISLTSASEEMSAEEASTDDLTVMNPNTSRMGLGDFRIGLNYQLSRGAWPLSLSGQLKLPTGYPGPQPNTVAQGSGQADLKTELHLGHYFRTGTVLGLEGGGVLRLNGPGHQVTYHAKIAQKVGDRLFIFIGQSGYHSITKGAGTGLENFVAKDPQRSGVGFTLDEDTYLLPFSLTQDLHQGELGFFLGTLKGVEYSGVALIPWAGKNTSQVFALHFDVRYRF